MDYDHLTTDGNDRTPWRTRTPGGFIIKSPEWTWRFYFCDNKNFMIYTNNPPNRFRRWMMKLLMDITWEKSGD